MFNSCLLVWEETPNTHVGVGTKTYLMHFQKARVTQTQDKKLPFEKENKGKKKGVAGSKPVQKPVEQISLDLKA